MRTLLTGVACLMAAAMLAMVSASDYRVLLSVCMAFSAIAILCFGAAIKKGDARTKGVALAGALLDVLVIADVLLRLFRGARLLDYF